MRHFEVGERVVVVNPELYILMENERTGFVTKIEAEGYEVALDNYTEDKVADGWDTLTFSPSSLRKEVK